MRNKKILNICLLTFALITLITFILPIKKFGLGENDAGFVRVMFYLLNAIMIMAVVALIVMSIVNLFKDNYTKVKLMEFMALLGFMMNFLVLLIFACSNGSQIYIGYLLVSIEIFVCCNFSQMSRLMSMGKELHSLDIDKPKILEKKNINADEKKDSNVSKEEKRKEDKVNHTIDNHNKNNNFKSNPNNATKQDNSTKQDNQNQTKESKPNND